MEPVDIILGVFLIVFYLAMFAFAITMYVLNGLGLMKMAKSCGLSHPWMGFVPFADVYLMGKLAEQNHAPGKKSWPWRHIALIGQIVIAALAIALCVWMVGDMTMTVIEGGEFTEYDVLSMYGGMIAFATPLSLLSTVYSVAVYIIYWKIFSLFAQQNTAVIFLVLTILFGLAPVFFFALRNRKPLNRPDPETPLW